MSSQYHCFDNGHNYCSMTGLLKTCLTAVFSSPIFSTFPVFRLIIPSGSLFPRIAELALVRTSAPSLQPGTMNIVTFQALRSSHWGQRRVSTVCRLFNDSNLADHILGHLAIGQMLRIELDHAITTSFFNRAPATILFSTLPPH